MGLSFLVGFAWGAFGASHGWSLPFTLLTWLPVGLVLSACVRYLETR